MLHGKQHVETKLEGDESRDGFIAGMSKPTAKSSMDADTTGVNADTVELDAAPAAAHVPGLVTARASSLVPSVELPRCNCLSAPNLGSAASVEPETKAVSSVSARAQAAGNADGGQPARAPDEGDGDGGQRGRLQTLLEEMSPSVADRQFSAVRRLALLAALCAAVEALPDPRLGDRLLSMARSEQNMLRAGRHERAMLGLRSQLQLLLTDLLKALGGDVAAEGALRLAARQQARIGTGQVATLLRMCDRSGQLLAKPPSAALCTGRQCHKDAWAAAGLVDARECYPIKRYCPTGINRSLPGVG